MTVLLRRRAVCKTPQDVAALAERNRRALLRHAAFRCPGLPSDIREEVLQEVVAELAFDETVRGDADFVRACIYKRLDSRLFNRRVQEHSERLVRGDAAEQVIAVVADADQLSNPEVRAIQNWQRRVLADVLSPFTAIERKVIRLRYRGGMSARRDLGTVSRRECAAMLGISVAEVRSIEDRVAVRVDAAITAYGAACETRAHDVSRAAQQAAGLPLAEGWHRHAAAGLLHAKACGRCAQVFQEERLRFAREIAVAIPLPAVAHNSISDQAVTLFAGVRDAFSSARRSITLLLRDPATSIQLSSPRGGGVALLAACGAIGGTAGVCGVTGFNPLTSFSPETPKPTVATARRAAASRRAPATPAAGTTIRFTSPRPLGNVAASSTTAPGPRPSPATRTSRSSSNQTDRDVCEACAERKTSTARSSARSSARADQVAPPEVPTAAAAAAGEPAAASAPARVRPAPAPAPDPAPADNAPRQSAGADLCEACAERAR